MIQRSLGLRSGIACSALRRPLARPTLCARPLTRDSMTPIRITSPSRSFATTPGYEGDKKGFRVSYLFGGLVGLGLLVTIYGLLEYYYSLGTWPEPIRTPLKAAIKARNSGDFDRSEAYFRKAIDAALAMPSTTLEPDPLLKLSGLYITMSSMFETTYQPIKAFSSLREALPHFGPEPLAKDPKYRIASIWAGSEPLTLEDHKRVIGISQKLGQMALQLSSTRVPPPFPVLDGGKGPNGWDQAAEAYLSSALTSMLRLGMKPATKTGGVAVAGRDVDLPEGSEGDLEDGGGRVDKRGLGMTMEALAEVYARRGQYDLAGNLLLQAVSTLLPPQSKEPPAIRDRCQAAMLMTTISSHALQPRTEQAIKASKSWSLRSLQIAQQALKENGDQVTDAASATCARARTVGLQNLGMLAELQNSPSEAMKLFTQALESAKDTNFAEAKREANEAIRRLRSATSST